MAQVGLTVRRQCQADTKVEHSEPTLCIRCRGRLSDKSYSRDNRLVPPKSPYRRRSSAPRCRLDLSWGWRRSQGFGCSPIKKVRELGSDRSGDFSYGVSLLNQSEPEGARRRFAHVMTSITAARECKFFRPKLTYIGKTHFVG